MSEKNSNFTEPEPEEILRGLGKDDENTRAIIIFAKSLNNNAESLKQVANIMSETNDNILSCLLYTSPSPRDPE